MVENVIAFLLFLASVAGSVSIFVDQLKPVIFNKILERNGEQIYLISIYLTRTVAGFVGLALLGGYPVLVELVPFFSRIPEIGVWVLSAGLITLGADYVHVLLDYLYAIRDGNRGDTVVVPAGDVNPVDLANLVKELNKPAIKDGGSVSIVEALG